MRQAVPSGHIVDNQTARRVDGVELLLRRLTHDYGVTVTVADIDPHLSGRWDKPSRTFQISPDCTFTQAYFLLDEVIRLFEFGVEATRGTVCPRLTVVPAPRDRH